MTKRLSMKGWAIMLVALITLMFVTALLGSAGIERAHAQEAKAEPKVEKHLPTSKDQCKKGGYKYFGFNGYEHYEFKNQGQCISFVQKQ